jgi:Ca-activated chloride channel family protein
MTRAQRTLTTATLALAVLATATPAQVPPPSVRAPVPATAPDPAPPQAVDGEVQLNADLVLVSAVVTKGGGQPLRDLKVSDFTVLDNGRPQPVAFFGDEELPLDVVFLFDASQSVQFRRKFQREALGAFLRTLLRPNDSAAVVWFNEGIHIEQDFTAQPGALLAALDRIPQGGATALYAAIGAASGRLATRPGHRAIVVLSDGRDTFSDLRLEGALELAQRAGAVIYAVNTSYAGWAVTPQYRRNDPLEFLAEQTGGEVYYTANADDVESALSRLSGLLRERYMLGFYPTNVNTGGAYHRLEIQVNRKDATVETRRGYFAR